MDAAQHGVILLLVLFSPCLGSCDVFYFWNACIYKVDVFAYLWPRTDSPLGDPDIKLNVGDENKHTLLCIILLCSQITRMTGLASCLVRMWTRVWSFTAACKTAVFRKKKPCGTFLSFNCPFASHGIGYFSAFDVSDALSPSCTSSCQLRISGGVIWWAASVPSLAHGGAKAAGGDDWRSLLKSRSVAKVMQTCGLHAAAALPRSITHDGSNCQTRAKWFVGSGWINRGLSDLMKTILWQTLSNNC